MQRKGRNSGSVESGNDLGEITALVAEQYQIRAAAYTKLCQKVRDVEFHRPLGDIQAAGDLFIGQILKQAAEHFLLATAQLAGSISAKASALGGRQDGIHEARKNLSW